MKYENQSVICLKPKQENYKYKLHYIALKITIFYFTLYLKVVACSTGQISLTQRGDLSFDLFKLWGNSP